MPDRTVFLIDKLSELGLPDAVFRAFHHLGTSMIEHRDYCKTVSSFKANHEGHRTNDLVRERLDYIYKEINKRGLTPPISIEVWQGLASEAQSRHRLAVQQRTQGIQPSQPKTSPAAPTDDPTETGDRLDDDVLNAFMSGFFGYGSPDASVWFVGMEEGGGDRFSEIERRLSCWNQRGQRQFEDLRDFHEAIGEHRWFAERRLQPTWSHLIRVYLSATLQSTDEDVVRNYQVDKLGREHGDTSLLELFPLPSPSTADWRYATWSSLPVLASRQCYQKTLCLPRIRGLKLLLTEHQPKAVVFYGTSYRDLWKQLIPTGGSTQHFDVAGSTIDVTEHARTVYAICAHPAARGISSGYFSTVGRKLRLMLKEQAQQ